MYGRCKICESLTKFFIRTLETILEYIAQDKLSASLKFKKEVDSKINNIITFSYKYRKSYYYNSDSIRDMTFKTYTYNLQNR